MQKILTLESDYKYIWYRRWPGWSILPSDAGTK